MQTITRVAMAVVAAALTLPLPARAAAEACVARPIDAGSLPALAISTLDAYGRDTSRPDPDTLFRLHLVAGQYRPALAGIEAVRASSPTAAQSPLYLQYEILARAKLLQAAGRLPWPDAWRQAFAERFGALDDATAWHAEGGFRGYLPRMQADLDAALAPVSGQRCVALADALDLLRKYQVHQAYAAFTPLVDDAVAADDARRYIVDRDALVRTPDGASIAMLVVRPAHAPPLPTLLQFTIYANDGWAWADAKRMASRGYASVVAYTRGKGRSPDAIVPYEHDGADAAAVIDWIAAQPWSDRRVGMYGGSYSGFTQWAALKHRPAALKAIATSATAAPGIDVPMEGGIFLNFVYPWPIYVASNRWLNDADYGDAARWATLNRKWYGSGRAYRELPLVDGTPNPTFMRWLQHPSYDAYWQAMIPQGEEFAGIDIPVLATTGYFDGAQVGALHYFREHLRHRPGADHTLVIGPFEHFSMQAGVPAEVQGYTTDRSARIDLPGLRLAWFDHVFKGGPKPELLADRVNWQVMGADTWRHAESLEEMAARHWRLYLVPGGSDEANRLAPQPQAGSTTVQRVDFSDRSDAAWVQPATVVNPSLDAHSGLVFASEPLPQATELAGPFSGVLGFTVNKRDVDVVIAVYERTAAGDYLELAYWLQRASHNADRSTRRLLEPGEPQHLVVKDTRLIGRRLAAGSRLVVTLGVIKQPDRQLNLGSGKPSADETVEDAGAPLQIRWRGDSYLDFGLE